MTSILFVKEPSLLVFPSLAKEIGLNEAIVLQQVHYWLDPKRSKIILEDRYWVHNTYEQWQKQFPFWCVRTIRRVFDSLEQKGFLFTFLKHSYHKTKFYTINYQELNVLNIQEPYNYLQDKCYPKLKTDLHHQKNKIRLDNLSTQKGQIVPIDQDNLSTLYNKNTETTYTDILPPLTPPSTHLAKKEEEEEILKKMIYYWNENVQVKLHPTHPQVQLTQTRYQRLRELLQNQLAGDPVQWQDYCLKISQRSYLMGDSPSGFRVTLDWALKPENAVKVLEGVIYDKPQAKKSNELTWLEYAAHLKEHCDQQGYSEDWLNICKELAQRVGQITFNCWLKQLAPIDVTGEIILLSAETRFACEFIETNFRFALMDALKVVYPHATAFRIQLKGNST